MGNDSIYCSAREFKFTHGTMRVNELYQSIYSGGTVRETGTQWGLSHTHTHTHIHTYTHIHAGTHTHTSDLLALCERDVTKIVVWRP